MGFPTSLAKDTEICSANVLCTLAGAGLAKLRPMLMFFRQLRHDGENGKPPVHVGSPAD